MDSSNRHLHIISFDIPYPANYGGVIDVFYKIRALHAAGIAIHLHCFEYGRQHNAFLKAFCTSVHYYPRNVSKAALFRKRPYIVISRISETLIDTLLQDDYPILFEGLHTCASLSDKRLESRKKIVRTHNVEHEYYRSLAAVEKNIFKRLYFYNEASKLEQFEETLAAASGLAAISPNDASHFSKINSRTFYLPAFHANETVQIAAGFGEFALYHGNLSVGENNKAALFLVNEVFCGSDVPLVIAGSKPSPELKSAILKYPNIRLVSDISADEITTLVQKAQVNVLPTFQPTGIKLKLLTALYNGRHVVVNPEMVQNTGLEVLCHVATDAAALLEMTKKLMVKEFDAKERTTRENVLNKGFSNLAGAKLLISNLF